MFSHLPLVLACRFNHLPIVTHLLQLTPATHRSRLLRAYLNPLALLRASSHGHLDIVQALLQHPLVDPSAESQQSVISAAMNGHVAVVDCLLRHPRTNPTIRGQLALIYAAGNGYLPVVERLLQVPGVDPSAQKYAALGYAAGRGHLVVVRRLLETGMVGEGEEDEEKFHGAVRLAAGGGVLIVTDLWAHMDPSWTNQAKVISTPGGHVDVVLELVKKNRGVRLAVLALDSAANAGYVRVVEAMLGCAGVAEEIGIARKELRSEMEKHCVAVRLCADRSRNGREMMRWIRDGYRLAYEVERREELPVGLGQILCEMVCSIGLGQYVSYVQRQIRGRLRQLKEYSVVK